MTFLLHSSSNTQFMGMQMQAAKASGSLNLQRLLDMQESGVDINSFTSSEMRLNMYSKEVGPALPSVQDMALPGSNASMLTCTAPWLGMLRRQLPLAHQSLHCARQIAKTDGLPFQWHVPQPASAIPVLLAVDLPVPCAMSLL